MAVVFLTSKPQAFLNDFKSRINQSEAKGKITTWSIDSDGDFTHKAADWANKAWFRPVVEADRLTFNIIKNREANMATIVYAYYHGHLIETFLNHFDKQFSAGSATAMPVAGDVCTS
ncbi:hypothetical protein [Rhizobium sp. 2MFCol3.1]|uniref:hypothetical protein n=1 Tax=Rhizobium sp. 2MFCol3.1 TaxID=1246459 RepID=UPI00035FCA24|nr:hypothetical protein [Rhizobium sp. 2MFCol3.1]